MNLSELRKRYDAEVAEMAKPVGRAQLLAKGILRKKGDWCEVLKPKDLPKHVLKHATAIETRRTGLMRIRLQSRKGTKR